MIGTVINNTGSWYTVLVDDGREFNCKVKGNFRIKGLRTTNPVAVGDRVEVTEPVDGSSFITGIEPRRNYIIRKASNLSKESHIIAANIDQAILVTSLAHPAVSTVFMDRFLATAAAYDVPVVIVINKIDLLTEPDDKELLEAVTYLYRSIGYDVLQISAKHGDGMDALQKLLPGKVSLLSGNSGVGKSSIINDIMPELNLRTAVISHSHDTGMHTTTFSTMYRLPEGGFIIDTPGVKGFGTVEFDPAEVSHYFPEIFEAANGCRYSDCSHTHEPGCAVLHALEEHRIAQSRYNSYLSILQDSGENKYRKPQ